MTEEKNILGFEHSAEGTITFNSFNPSLNSDNAFTFYKATTGEINRAAEKAAAAAGIYSAKSGLEKAAFLEAIADGLLEAGDELVKAGTSETGLPAGRIEGERGRTIQQLKMFANLLKEGSWVDARIDTAIPDRAPVPKPDLRSMLRPLGPVVIFGASNFPLAFSVAGGDTASALAAGCPVIVKAHNAHPATSAIAGKVIQAAAKKTGMPDGVFSLLFDDGTDAGMQLVQHPEIKAVGFTGSFRGGKAIFDAAMRRPIPIPVYAEMGSSNPVFILPKAMAERGEAIAAGYAASVTMGVGQFCTNPGILFYQQQDGSIFKETLKENFAKTTGGVMLTSPIANSYKKRVDMHLAINGIEVLAKGNESPIDTGNSGTPVLFASSAEVFGNNESLSEEIFGPTSIAVSTASKKEMLRLAEALSGHLTATIYGNEEELAEYSGLINILEKKVGRIVFNNFPTGVEVCSSMVHGGPFPATTDSRTTSVGTGAILRFSRAICYQNMPDALLPIELKNENKLKIHRLVNNELSAGPIN